MRKESLITLTRPQFEAHIARQIAWYEAAHAPKKNTRKAPAKATPAPKKSTPSVARTPKTPTTAANVDARMSELRERFGLAQGEDLAWDDEDLLTVEG